MTCSGYNARYDWLNSIRTSFSQGSVKEKTKQKSRNKLLINLERCSFTMISSLSLGQTARFSRKGLTLG